MPANLSELLSQAGLANPVQWTPSILADSVMLGQEMTDSAVLEATLDVVL
jgi:hypothetical protein